MTIGIYKLIFPLLEDWPYIGQSSNIEIRYTGHCSALKLGKSNFKMQEAYELCGNPNLEILEECKIEDLSSREIYWIKEFNSVNNGLNLTDKCVNGGHGEDSFKSKYSNNLIETAFLYIVANPDKNLKEISRITGITRESLSSIRRGSTHLWLKEKYPKEYDIMSHQSRRGLNNAIYQNIEYPPVCSPDGLIFNIINLQKFCRENDLNSSCMHGVLHGNRKTHKKWKLAA